MGETLFVCTMSHRDENGEPMTCYVAHGGWDLVPAAPAPQPPISLDAAWARCEAALPEGVSLADLTSQPTPDGRLWTAWAYDFTYMNPDMPIHASGPTPAAAIEALAERLEARR